MFKIQQYLDQNTSNTFFRTNGSLFTQMGLFSHKWVSFHTNGSLFTQMGLFSHKWVSFHTNRSLFTQMGLVVCLLASCSFVVLCVRRISRSEHFFGSFLINRKGCSFNRER